MATCHRQRFEVFPKPDNFADTFEKLAPRCFADFRATSTVVNFSLDSPENIPRMPSEFCPYGESWKEGRTWRNNTGHLRLLLHSSAKDDGQSLRAVMKEDRNEYV